MSSWRGSIRSIHDHARALALQLLDEPRDLGRHLRRVGGTDAQHQLDVGRQLGGGAEQVRNALLPRVAADEHDARPRGVDARARDNVVALVPVPHARRRCRCGPP